MLSAGKLNIAWTHFVSNHLDGRIRGRNFPSNFSPVHSFRAREIDVLVSTTIVEVGVDVPNATLLVVEHAERFGLSQLHQLRGRVSRGAVAGQCYLFAEPASDEAKERLRLLTACV